MTVCMYRDIHTLQPYIIAFMKYVVYRVIRIKKVWAVGSHAFQL